MTPSLWTRWTLKEFALSLAIVICVCTVAFLLANLARAKPFPAEHLGAEWQCHKTLFLTTCTKTLRSSALLRPLRKDAVCLRQA